MQRCASFEGSVLLNFEYTMWTKNETLKRLTRVKQLPFGARVSLSRHLHSSDPVASGMTCCFL